MRVICFWLLLGSLVHADEFDARLRMAMQIARERNDRALVRTVEDLAKSKPSDAELRKVEAAVGIDPGGWSMAAQPLFHPTPEMLAELKLSGPKLNAAMESGDPKAVQSVATAMMKVLGNQAGVPDGRRAGKKPTAVAMNEAEATRLFLNALDTQGHTMRQLMDAKALPDQMVRLYAYVLDAMTTIHPWVKKHVPERLNDVERLTRGTAALLLSLQQPAGHFPFPDLRGKNIRFGEMTEKQLKLDTVEVKGGWLITADPNGGTQFDTGLCGVALLRAGELHGRTEWKKAGLRAADWAMQQKCCSNFNYNAFSVSLLAQAGRITGDGMYHEAALAKFRLGVAPGQAPNGRWLDPHNARTVYHIIILRALGDLGSSTEVDAVAKPAIQALLDEFDAMGITVEALPELLTLAQHYPDDERLRKAVQSMAASLIAKCTDGKRVKMGAQPNQLAAVAGVLSGPLIGN